MPAIVSFVGRSNSGKTTLIEKVILELKSRGYSIASAKNVSHNVVFDQPGKDSWRHIQAGSKAVVISSPGSIVLIKPIIGNVNIYDVVRLFGEDYDLIILEGYKRSEFPKIEVHRKEIGPPLLALKNLIAIATDEPLGNDIKQFPLTDINGIVNLLETRFIKKQTKYISVHINNKLIPIENLPEQMIDKIIDTIYSISEVKNIENIALFLRTDTKKQQEK